MNRCENGEVGVLIDATRGDVGDVDRAGMDAVIEARRPRALMGMGVVGVVVSWVLPSLSILYIPGR